MAERAIVLIGFMGAGKSSAARTMRGAGGKAVDLDAEIEKQTEGLSVREFFDRVGEEEFRALECRVADATLAANPGAVVALGGGSAMQADIQALLADHTVVLLDVKAADAWDRVATSDRPLVQRGEESFHLLFEERLPTYERLADVVIPAARPKAVAEAIDWIGQLSRLPAGTRMIWAQTEAGGYPIFVGRGLLESKWWPLDSRRFCITDSSVGAMYASRLAPLEAKVEVAPGEQAKSLAETERILRALVAAGMRRDDHVVALGGGVIGDLGGFCAHIFQRGVAVVQVPTTFVAQVDSAYGGKTGVDLPEGKNYAGAYQQPAAVLVDTSILSSLPKWEIESGFVEALKTGLLAGGELWRRVQDADPLDPDTIDYLVFACARYKCEVVAEDEHDSGWRNVLNLGHTVGHAIESATAYEHYSHGEAIGLGLLAALRLSEAPDLRDRVEAVLDRLSLPTRISADLVDAEAILDALQRDKKRTAEGIGFVLLSKPGNPRVGQLVDPARVRDAVEELLG